MARKLLEEANFNVTVWDQERPMTREELLEAAQHCDALLSTSLDKINEAFLLQCKHLEVISTFAVGFDNIDLRTANKLNIPVGHTPGVLTEATADAAFGLMLAVTRKMFFQHQRIKDGGWQYFQPMGYLGQDLRDKTLGIFGLGAIGFEMARLCKAAYHMPIIYHNRNHNAEAERVLQAKHVSFEELLNQSDVLSIHANLNADTRNKFDAAALSKMNPMSILINTARGGLVNEPALIQALRNQEIWGAGLDVTNPEPMESDNPLLQMENVAVLPHIGSATFKARTGMARLAAENIIAFYEVGKVVHQARY